jgi:N-acetylglucosamine malate deacetylase 1
MKLGWRRALVLGAHPDDEMGCAGLVVRLLEEGCEIHHYYFSDCAISTKARGFEPEQLLIECEASRDVLGIPTAGRGSFNFPVREFPAHRQSILEELVKLDRAIAPDLVLTATTTDLHQDHGTLTSEAIRAFKKASILGYELPWNNLEFASAFYVQLEPHQLAKKISSISCYATQRKAQYVQKESIEAIARVRGLQSNAEFAECFQVVKLIA